MLCKQTKKKISFILVEESTFIINEPGIEKI